MLPPAQIRQVWRYNMRQELRQFHFALKHNSIVSVDAEFPGCLLQTPRKASECVRFSDMRFNVDSTDLIQLGLTVSDAAGGISATWQFNFCFDLDKDQHAVPSVRFLKKNGVDFEELKKNGIDRSRFAPLFAMLLRVHRNRNLTWVTFHGLYDMGYLYKTVAGNGVPASMQDFALYLATFFGRVIDLKHCSTFSEELLHGELGLERLGQLLRVERIGGAHHAGSDSLLTASAFHGLAKICNMESPNISGFLYGLSARISLPACFTTEIPKAASSRPFRPVHLSGQSPLHQMPLLPPLYIRTF